MVGIVVVSHSRPLARAAVALAEEMVPGRGVRIVVAAGLDENTTGTDATAILQALGEADDGGGVVVLMDLGSAVLSAELALDLLDDPDARSRVLLCPAPLVEGLVAAVVSAAAGAGREEVAAEAVAALAGKQSHLAGPSGVRESDARESGIGEWQAREPGAGASGARGAGAESGAESAGGAGAGETVGRFVLVNPHGLHARPAARLVQLVREFDAEVRLTDLRSGTGPVSASSLSEVAVLGARCGDEVEVRAGGSQAAEAVSALLALAATGFGEGAGSATGCAGAAGAVAGSGGGAGVGVAEPVASEGFPGPSSPASSWRGIPASPGIVVAAVRRPRAAPVTLESDLPSVAGAAAVPGPAGPAAERARLSTALDTVRAAVTRLRDRAAAELGAEQSAIFDAHLLMLDDGAVLADVTARIDAGTAAAVAWQQVLRGLHDRFAALPDPYLRARAADVRAIGEQVLAELVGVAVRAIPSVAAVTGRGVTAVTGGGATDSGGTGAGSDGAGGPAAGGRVVLVAADLTPAQAAELDPGRVAAVVLAGGSPTSHAAILARARGVPAVVAAGDRALLLVPGTVLAVDATTGDLVADPDAATVTAYTTRAAELAGRRDRALAAAGSRARTRDGVEVLVGANLGGVDDARAAARAGADLAGLVRTEFLFLGRSAAPDVEEQEKAYRELAEALGGRRLTLRTLDVGGDKPLPYLPLPAEANPFLGVRGLRLALRRPDLLAEQLLAVVRVARETPVSVMFPMVSTVRELLAARAALDEAVRRDGRGTPEGLRVGMMVEVPAAALKAAAFARHVDFLSVGTNDLTQYALAAERGNDAVAALGDPLDPGVLRLLDAVCRGVGAGTGGPLVAVCGELAADERATGLLAGFGVRELSVAPGAVPTIKEAVRAGELSRARELAARALAAEGAEEVRALLENALPTG